MNPFLDAFVTALVYKDQDQLRHLLTLDLAKILPEEMIEEAKIILEDNNYEVPPYILQVIEQVEATSEGRHRVPENLTGPRTRY